MRILMVGCGGYAAGYINELLSKRNAGEHQIAGIVDPYAARSTVWDKIAESGIPVYDTIDDFYRRDNARLAIISTPIHLHALGALNCLKNGSHVLLEKPMAATAALARQIMDAAKAYDRKLGVGYQLCYDPVMLSVKADIDAGKLGKPLFLRVIALTHRVKAYFARSTGWSGKKLSPDGAPIYDSILTNATNHYVMNMLWLTTPGYETKPALNCQAQLGRANPIETFDTAAARFALPCGCEGMIYVSHAAGREQDCGPLAEYAFENGAVYIRFEPNKGLCLSIADARGEKRELGTASAGIAQKIERMTDAIERNAPLPCPGAAGLASTISCDMLFDNDLKDVEVIRPVHEDAELIWAEGVGDTLLDAYSARKLPREMGRSFSPTK